MSTPVWTDPTTHVWATGEVVTAANLNTYVQQDIANLNGYVMGTAIKTISAGSVASSTLTQISGPRGPTSEPSPRRTPPW